MSLLSAFGMLYLSLLLNLSASLMPSRDRKQVAHFIVVCLWEIFDIYIVICLLELSVASNLLGVCVHTLPTCFHWNVVLVFTVELIRIFVTINRATSGCVSSLLFAPEKVGVRVILINRGRGTGVLHHCGLPLEKLVPMVSSFAPWKHCPLPQTWLACVYVHCRLVYIKGVT